MRFRSEQALVAARTPAAGMMEPRARRVRAGAAGTRYFAASIWFFISERTPLDHE